MRASLLLFDRRHDTTGIIGDFDIAQTVVFLKCIFFFFIINLNFRSRAYRETYWFRYDTCFFYYYYFRIRKRPSNLATIKKIKTLFISVSRVKTTVLMQRHVSWRFQFSFFQCSRVGKILEARNFHRTLSRHGRQFRNVWYLFILFFTYLQVFKIFEVFYWGGGGSLC